MTDALELVLTQINPLTTEQRIAAEDTARKRIAGDEPVYEEPSLDEFNTERYTKFHPRVVFWINRAADLTMLAAFIPSALRIFSAGQETAMRSFATPQRNALLTAAQAAPDPAFGIIVGICSVMLAEVGMIAFTLALATIEDYGLRRILTVFAIACALFAFVGNWHVVMRTPDDLRYVFTWFEAILPPALALGAAQIRKAGILNASASRFRARRAYETALQEAKVRFADALEAHRIAFAEAHLREDWMTHYANALWDLLWAVNRNGRRREDMRSYGAMEKRILVERELRAANWWETAEAQRELPAVDPHRIVQFPEQPNAKPASGASGGEATGEAAELIQFVQWAEDGTGVLHCPCGLRSPVSASKPNASIAAHTRNQHHKAWRNARQSQSTDVSREGSDAR